MRYSYSNSYYYFIVPDNIPSAEFAKDLANKTQAFLDDLKRRAVSEPPLVLPHGYFDRSLQVPSSTLPESEQQSSTYPQPDRHPFWPASPDSKPSKSTNPHPNPSSLPQPDPNLSSLLKPEDAPSSPPQTNTRLHTSSQPPVPADQAPSPPTDRNKQGQFVTALQRLSPEQGEILRRYLQMMTLKRYSPQTIKTYRSAFMSFLAWCGSRLPLDLSSQDILDYLARCIEYGSISESYQNIIINAIKFYFEKVEGKPRTIYSIPRPKRYEPLPKVLDKEEIKRMIHSTANLKHRCLLLLLYGSGLRLGEVLNLLPNDVDRARGILHIRRAKGKKDREVPIHPTLVDLMAQQMIQGKHITWVFEGSNPGEPYSDRSVQLIVKQAANRAGITRPVTVHMLRHSYATHLMEDGIDLRIIQSNLGHSSIKTTEIYTHVARQQKPRSPLDDILGPSE